jgi:uncharacterized membrane protein YfcA
MPIYLPVAGMALDSILLATMGLTVGILSGMFGIGGGFIVTPLLIFMGVPPLVAVGTGVGQVVATSVSGALGHWRRGNVDVQMGLVLITGGLLGSVLGVALQRFLKALGQLDLFIALTYVIVLGVVGSLMLMESISTLRKGIKLKGISLRRGGQHTWVQGLPLKWRFRTSRLYISTVPVLLLGVVVGLLTAIIGVGGGFLLVPALIYVLKVPTRVAIGTSMFQIVFIAAFTVVLQSILNHSVDIVLGLPLMIGGVIGAQYGVVLSQRLNAEQLRILLALLVIAVAVRMAVGVIAHPSELYVLDTRQ